jgi:hypothetical protein
MVHIDRGALIEPVAKRGRTSWPVSAILDSAQGAVLSLELGATAVGGSTPCGSST